MADTKVIRDEHGDILAIDGGNVQRRCVVDGNELMIRIVEEMSGKKRPPRVTPEECLAGLVREMQEDDEEDAGDAEQFFYFLSLAAGVAIQYFCEVMAAAEPVQ